MDVQGRRNIDLLAKAPGVRLRAIFSPEHGLTGQLDVHVPHGRDAATGRQAVVDPADADAAIRAVDATGGTLDLILLTHHLDTLTGFDRVLVMDAGRIVFDGGPEAAVEYYVDLMERRP